MGDDECSPGRLRVGMCERHYRRVRASGSTADPRTATLTRYEVDADGCWIYQGPAYPNGYGKLSRKEHGTRLAHRASYVEHRGPIPEGMDLDHLCRKRLCMRPDCLEPVTRQVNLERGHEARKVCEAGLHSLLDPANVRPGTKQCLPCWRERYRAAGARYRARKRSA